jgi:hypothetical protein
LLIEKQVQKQGLDWRRFCKRFLHDSICNNELKLQISVHTYKYDKDNTNELHRYTRKDK